MKYHALFVIFEKRQKLNCRPLQVIGGDLRIKLVICLVHVRHTLMVCYVDVHQISPWCLLQTFLGIKVEQDLQRKQADRRDRREHFGDVKMKKTQLYGKLCSPFQALSVPVRCCVHI